MASQVTIKRWECPVCHNLYTSEYAADHCCMEYHCEVCGKPTKKYFLKCSECAEKERFDKAKKITEEEWDNLHKDEDWMVYYGDTYYYSIEDFLDNFDEDYMVINKSLPKYVWATKKIPVEIDAEWVLDNTIENASCEDDGFDFDEVGQEEFCNFCSSWNDKYGKYVYEVDYKIVILLP